MIKKIKDISELPAWFFERDYKSNISDIEWYREIRRRQFLKSSIDSMGKHFEQLRKSSDYYIKSLTSEIRPDSLIYLIEGQNLPIADLTVGETVFLGSAISSSRSEAKVEQYQELLKYWQEVLNEQIDLQKQNQRTPKFGLYEKKLYEFTDNYDSEVFDANISENLSDSGNPFLSLGRPLNGHPLTVDTQFDDKTILKHFQLWLKNIRQKEKTKAVRPFNQNDYDDWAYFKIREVFDLQTWARIENVKILDRVIAKAVWPHAPEELSPIDVYRTTAKKKVDDIFQFETVVRMYGQLTMEYGENFFAK